MAHYDIRLRIVCGETTCAVRAGEFCEYHERRGGGHHCRIFGWLGEGPGGWIMRRPECIAASTPAEKPKGTA